MTLLTRVATDTVREECEAYIALNGDSELDGVAVDMVYEQVQGQLEAWPQSKAEKQEIHDSISRKLGVY